MPKIVEVPGDIRFVNVGEAPPNPPPQWTYSRQWPACVIYKFLSAGQGLKYNTPMRQISKHDIVAAYITRKGYVGVGKVTTPKAIKIMDFEFNGRKFKRDFDIDKKIISGELMTDETVEGLPFLRKSLFRNCTNEKTEYLIGVNWIEVKDKIDACWLVGRGLYAKPHIQCSLENQPVTITFLEESFNIKFKR